MSTLILLISLVLLAPSPPALLFTPGVARADSPEASSSGADEASSIPPLLLVSPRPAEPTPRALLRERLTQLRTQFRSRLDELNPAILASQDPEATRKLNAELRALKLDFEIDVLEAQFEAAPKLVDATKRDNTLRSLREAIEALEKQRNAMTSSNPVPSVDEE